MPWALRMRFVSRITWSRLTGWPSSQKPLSFSTRRVSSQLWATTTGLSFGLGWKVGRSRGDRSGWAGAVGFFGRTKTSGGRAFRVPGIVTGDAVELRTRQRQGRDRRELGLELTLEHEQPGQRGVVVTHGLRRTVRE